MGHVSITETSDTALLKHTLRRHMARTFSDADLKRWFDPLSLTLDEAARSLDVSFPHAFFASWFDEHAKARFEDQCAHYFGPGYSVRYHRNGRNGRQEGGETVEAPRASAARLDFPFGHQFTFDNFLVNSKNYFPLASAKEVSKQKTAEFNPLIICGESGSGKTHLLRAVANELARARGDAARIWLGTVEELGAAYENESPRDAFKTRSRLASHDALLVDDFHQIQRRPELQEELIILFDLFHNEKKQMIFACQDKLGAYEFLDPKLKSRLEWGLILSLKRPDLDIRARFVQSQCKQRKLPLSQEQVLTLAQRFMDFRFLQGILLKFSAYKDLMGSDIGDKDFEEILSHTEDKPKPALTAEGIIDAVAEHFEVDRKDVTGARRHHRFVQPRQVAMYLCRQLLGSSYPALGRIFGGKDHSTVLYAVNKIDALLRENKEMKQVVNMLRDKCLSGEEG